MRILLAGGSGVIGIRLIPRLSAAGHQVTATTRHAATAPILEAVGAEAAVVDVYDAARLDAVVAQAAPDLVLHELTDLSTHDTDANARLRREGTANLVAAALANGVERMLVQSVAWAVADGEGPADEGDPLVPGSAVETMERLVQRVPHSTVLRYGLLYGPTTWYAPDGAVAGAVQAGGLPATPAVTSFLHIDDAVSATVAALDWPDGVYNVVDDEPAAGTEWLPVFAARVGAPTPQSAPLADGAPAGRPVSNAKARALGWVPTHPTWRDALGAEGVER